MKLSILELFSQTWLLPRCAVVGSYSEWPWSVWCTVVCEL